MSFRSILSKRNTPLPAVVDYTGSSALLRSGSIRSSRSSNCNRKSSNNTFNHGCSVFPTITRTATTCLHRPIVVKPNLSSAAWGIRTTAVSEMSTATATATVNSNPSTPPQIDFYQYAICPFCNKTKSFLQYANIPYNAIEVNPLTKAELKWSPEYRKVPVAQATIKKKTQEKDEDAETLVWKGSDDIVQGLLQQDWVIQQLQQRWNNTTKQSSSAEDNHPMNLNMFQGGVGEEIIQADDSNETKKKKNAHDWIQYANDELAVLLYPNLCPTLTESYQAFQYVDKIDKFSTWQKIAIRTIGSVAMYLAASRVKRKYKIENEKEALMAVLQKPKQYLEQQNQSSSSSSSQSFVFLSGCGEPHLGDLAVFGALRGIEGTRIHHEIFHPSSSTTMDGTTTTTTNQDNLWREWYHQMEQKVVGGGPSASAAS